MVTSKWQYFNTLSFLKEIVIPRDSSGNCVHQHNVTTESDNETDNQENNVNKNVSECTSDYTTTDPSASTEVEQVVQNVSSFDKYTISRVKSKRSDEYQSSILEVERKKLEILFQKRSNKKSNSR